MRLPLSKYLLALTTVLLVLATVLLVPAVSFGQDRMGAMKAEKTPAILFVCEHGAAKSVLAAAYFDKLARNAG